jgi:UDP-N-acetylmuramoyl-L-alanyl-D-glutamate--2,6-diaminopimelate ligase
MAILSDLLYKTSIQAVIGLTNIEVSHITADSRKAGPGMVFVAVTGTQVDGHAFLQQAIQQGVVAVVCESLPINGEDADITFVQVKDSAEALGILASNFYGNPSSKLNLVGITGTNGKTTIATLLYQLFKALGYRTGLISTVKYHVHEEEIESTHTTPDPMKLNELLAAMVRAKCTHAFMEVSSHAVVQRRIAGLQFTGGVFSNITHDHLDFHKTFDNYIAAKKRFFDDLSPTAFVLANADDKRGQVMMQNTRAAKHYFSLRHHQDFSAKIISNSIHGLELEVLGHQTWFKLIGEFNASNLLAVIATAKLLHEDDQEILIHLSTLNGVAGRFERVESADGVTAIVDYAHTPDALQNVLQTLNKILGGKDNIITLVGCGGNRDKEKRPVMAEIAVKNSGKTIFTSDNPRNEKPEDIIDDMMNDLGATMKRRVVRIENREEAIKQACAMARPGDVILIAGKGHENYQEIAGVKHPFNDKELVIKYLNLNPKPQK